MSKLYDLYVKEKSNDKDLLYLFECGKFYIFIDEDAIKINSITTLKLTKLNDSVFKCGFPNNSLDKYMEIFKNLDLKVKIIKYNDNKILDNNKVIKKLKNININEVTPMESINLLKEIKEYLDE